MNVTLINNLVEKYAELSHNKLNHFELITEKGRYLEEEYTTLDYFFGRLYDTGNYASFVFTNNSLPASVFFDTLKDLSFPIIAFKRADKLTPVIIYQEKGKHKACVFSGKEIEDDPRPQETGLLDNLLTVEAIDKSYAYRYTKPGSVSDNANEIFFITGIPVKPLLSDTRDNENKEKGDEKAEEVSPMTRLFRLMSTESREITLIYFFAVLVGLVNLALPLGIQSIITLISGGMMLNSIIMLTFVIVTATAFAGYLQVLQLTFVEILQQRVFAKAAYEFSYRIPKIKLEAISKEYGPELVNRFFDVINIQKSLPKFLIDITAALLQIVFGMVLLSFYHQIFILLGFMLIGLIAFIIYLTGPKGLKSSITESKYKYKVAYWLEELARNATTFKLAGYTNLTIDKTDNYLSSYLKARQNHFKVLKVQYITIIFFKTFITASLLILGGVLVFNEQINIGQFIAAELIIVLVISAVEKLIATLDVVYDLLTALDKVGQVTDLPLEHTKGMKLEAIPDFENFHIELKNLSYAYKDARNKALNNINLSIKAGEKVCVAGYNNSGKTTLIKILTGLYHDYEGSFSINKVPMKDINIYSYRDTIGENISHDEIFEGTIEENITVGKKSISLEKLLWAIDEVGLTSFVNRQPEGIRTKFVGGGRDLSSNIRQKIILARSIAEVPQLLVMDDEFFTEPNEKRSLIEVLFKKENPWSLVMVTNDPMLLSQADKVLFIHKGESLAEGRFETLMQREDFARLVVGIY